MQNMLLMFSRPPDLVSFFLSFWGRKNDDVVFLATRRAQKEKNTTSSHLRYRKDCRSFPASLSLARARVRGQTLLSVQ